MATQAENQLTAAAQGIKTSEAQIKQAEQQLADARASGNQAKINNATRLLNAAKANLPVFQARAEAALKIVAQEKIREQQALQARLERERIAAEQKARAEAEARTKAQQLAESKRLAEERAKQVFESQRIQQEVKPAFETTTEFTLANLEQRRRDALEIEAALNAQRRLGEGTTIFETGAGFERVDDPEKGQKFFEEGKLIQVKDGVITETPVKQQISPESSKGQFISGTQQAQLVDVLEDIPRIDTVIGAIKTEIPGTPEFEFTQGQKRLDVPGSGALAVFEQSNLPQTSPALRPGSTALFTGEELGLAGPSKEFKSVSGELIVDVLPPSEFAKQTGQDPFLVAQQERESQGLIPGTPLSFSGLFGFPSQPLPPKPSATPKIGGTTVGGITTFGGIETFFGAPRPQPQDPISILTSAGLTPTKEVISQGFIPTDAPISEPKLPTKKLPPPTIPAVIVGAGATEASFDKFLSDIGSSFGLDTVSGFFANLQKSINLDNIFAPPPPKKLTAKDEIALARQRGDVITTDLIARAFPEESRKAAALGFQISSTGEIFEGSRRAGTFTGLGATTVEGLQTKISAREEEKRRKAEEKRLKELEELFRPTPSRGTRGTRGRSASIGDTNIGIELGSFTEITSPTPQPSQGRARPTPRRTSKSRPGFIFDIGEQIFGQEAGESRFR